MTARRIIHAYEDVSIVLRQAMELGLVVQQDSPTDLPKPDIIEEKRFSEFTSGVFLLYKPEWVFGDLSYHKITCGFNKGKYFQAPHTNISAIDVYFSGERMEGENLRLGSGLIGYSNEWLSEPGGNLFLIPTEVKDVFNSLINNLYSGIYLSGGSHRYIVLENAIRKLAFGDFMPPFDYIRWK